jgi:hypothetical protein
MGGFVINSTVNSSPNEKKTMAGFIGEKSGLIGQLSEPERPELFCSWGSGQGHRDTKPKDLVLACEKANRWAGLGLEGITRILPRTCGQ